MFKIFASLVAIVASVQSECLVPTTKEAFDLTKYAGEWFMVHGIVESQGTTKCGKEIFTTSEDGKTTVKRDGTNLFGIVLEACGHAEIPDEANSGSLNMNYPDDPHTPYLVLDTDYENWAAVYSCKEDETLRYEDSVILSRTKEISPELLESAIQLFVNLGVNTTVFEPITHDEECDYESLFPGHGC